MPTTKLDLTELFALCFAFPWSIGDDCEHPSAGQCFAILTLPQDTCDITTCEYVECMEALAEQDTCAKPPKTKACQKLIACDAAENG